MRDSEILGAHSTDAAQPIGPQNREQSREQSPETRAGLDQSRTTALVTAADLVSPAVVTINVIRTQQVTSGWFDFFGPRFRKVSGLGSGFVVDPDGTIVTNDHVVAGAERIMVTLQDGRDLEAEVVGTDPTTDIAVLRVDGQNLPVAPLGSSAGLQIGEWAVAIGNPFGNLFSNSEATVTAGVISAVNRHILGGSEEEGFYLGMIQTDAAINPGNSGGPLVNALGEVVGVNSSIFSRSGGSEGLGFAIPIDRALAVADDLVRFGEVRRPWLGFDVEAAEADEWGRTRGVRISRVAGGSPAAEAGIRAGSVLSSAAGNRLTAPLDFESVLLDLRAGDRVSLQVEGRAAAISLLAEARPTTRAERVPIIEGFEVVTVTTAIQLERNLQNDFGALVMKIGPQASSSLSLREGDVLLQVNDRKVETAEDARDAFENLQGRGLQLAYEREGRISTFRIIR